jgi:DNA-binding MarR family transcriptional regulator
MGLVKRRRQRSDRRVVIVNIANKGLDLLDKMDQPVSNEVDNMLSSVNDSDMAELIDLLEKVRDSVYKNNP